MGCSVGTVFKSSESGFKWAASWQNQQNGMCAQGSLRSAWASAQCDQSFRCPHEESLGPYLPVEHTAKILIRLGRYPGWSESSLDADTLLLVLPWGGLNFNRLQVYFGSFWFSGWLFWTRRLGIVYWHTYDPTSWENLSYMSPIKTQINLRIHVVLSVSLLFTPWIFALPKISR